ncbi:MAG: DUF2007 domain-containing protein [Desulfarculaceae bacterium]|jgi:hypothetical protein
MKKVFSPENDAELALIISLLEGEGIEYFVHNDHFGALKIGPPIDMFNVKTIMVPEGQFDLAKEIIEDFLAKTQEAPDSVKAGYSLGDKVRMILETVLFGWFIPGKRRGRGRPRS